MQGWPPLRFHTIFESSPSGMPFDMISYARGLQRHRFLCYGRPRGPQKPQSRLELFSQVKCWENEGGGLPGVEKFVWRVRMPHTKSQESQTFQGRVKVEDPSQFIDLDSAFSGLDLGPLGLATRPHPLDLRTSTRERNCRESNRKAEYAFRPLGSATSVEVMQ